MSAYSYEVTTASGSTSTVNVPFPYLSQQHVHVYLNGTEVTPSTLVWTTSSLIQLPSTPASGVKVKVQRVTPFLTPLVVFEPGGLSPKNLNDQNLQELYVSQEIKDEADLALELDASTSTFDARGDRIINLADPVNGTDAVTKQWVQAHTVSDDSLGHFTAHNEKIVNLAEPTAATDAATKNYTDAAVSAVVIGAGVIGKGLDGQWDGKSLKLENLAAPVAGGDATTKTYVDAAITSHTTGIAPFVAAGGSHAAGDVPDPGATAGLKRFLGDDATWHAAKDQRLYAQPLAGKRCLLSDYGLITGATPGVNNAALLNAVFAAATPGDLFVLPTNGDLVNYGQLTFFDSRPSAVPEKCTLTGANDSPSASGMVRQYAVSDFREPFVTLSPESCTVENMTLYIKDGFSSGSAIGAVQTSGQFYIHPRIRNVHTTCFGTTAAWATPLCLDGSASDGVNSKGIRECRIENCAFWQYDQYGMYLQSVLGGVIINMTLTPKLVGGVPVVPSGADISLGGTSIVPSYSNVLIGGQIGVNAILGKATNNLIMGGVGKVTFNDAGCVDNRIVDPTFSFVPVFNAGTRNVVHAGDRMFSSHGIGIGRSEEGTPIFRIKNYTVIVSMGGVPANGFVITDVTCAGARVGDAVTVEQANLGGIPIIITAWVSTNDTIRLRFNNYSTLPQTNGDTLIHLGLLGFSV